MSEPHKKRTQRIGIWWKYDSGWPRMTIDDYVTTWFEYIKIMAGARLGRRHAYLVQASQLSTGDRLVRHRHLANYCSEKWWLWTKEDGGGTSSECQACGIAANSKFSEGVHHVAPCCTSQLENVFNYLQYKFRVNVLEVPCGWNVLPHVASIPELGWPCWALSNQLPRWQGCDTLTLFGAARHALKCLQKCIGGWFVPFCITILCVLCIRWEFLDKSNISFRPKRSHVQAQDEPSVTYWHGPLKAAEFAALQWCFQHPNNKQHKHRLAA